MGGANASRWLRIPIVGIGFQTSTLAGVVLLAYVAKYLHSIRDKAITFKQSLLPSFPRERYFFAYEKVVSWTGFAYKVQSAYDVHIISSPVYV